LLPDRNSSDLSTNKTAVLTTDGSATDSTAVRFVGRENLADGTISGLVGGGPLDPVPDAAVWIESFVYPTNESLDFLPALKGEDSSVGNPAR